MTLLLDTHAFLWFINGDRRLSPPALAAIENPDSVLRLSIAALWEVTVKASLGRLQLPARMSQFVREHVYGNRISLLPIEPHHLELLESLPFHHKDPFDRLIIAQAEAEQIAVVSGDNAFSKYDVSRVW